VHPLKQAFRRAYRRGAYALERRLRQPASLKRDPGWLTGDFQTWDAAVAASRGYDAREILDAVKHSVGRVQRGVAAYERDSILFDRVEYSWPLLSALMWEAAQSGGRLDVLDIGGSLGTTYFQNRRFLSDLSQVRWNIVEQPHYVHEGRAAFQSEQLRFYESLEGCLAETAPTVAILSGVLPYVEKPYDLLQRCLSGAFRTVVIDRTFLWNGSRDRLCVQDVPSDVLPRSYPIWIFSQARFLDALSSQEIVAEFQGFADEADYVDCQPRGFVVRCSRRIDRGRI
jgi:putative methyltransferase (TIGR04325 family)